MNVHSRSVERREIFSLSLSVNNDQVGHKIFSSDFSSYTKGFHLEKKNVLY